MGGRVGRVLAAATASISAPMDHGRKMKTVATGAGTESVMVQKITARARAIVQGCVTHVLLLFVRPIIMILRPVARLAVRIVVIINGHALTHQVAEMLVDARD
jgi:hypothetical protein